MLSCKNLQLFTLLTCLAVTPICKSQVATAGPVFIGGGVGAGMSSTASVRVSASIGGVAGASISGKPFCADIETIHTQILADGNRIQNTGHEHICRDSQGRVRTETQPVMINAPRELPVHTMVSIIDPTTNVHYTLIPDQHKAIKHEFRVSTRPATLPANIKPAPQAITPRPVHNRDTSIESLGTESINGFVAKGTKITSLIPAGTVGNEQPLTTTTENWFSDDLSEMILTKHSDPRSGDMVREMKNITREEPDPSLFQIPVDYTVEELPPPVRP